MTDVRDCMGRTISYHLAMFPKATDSQLKKINLMDQDWESGYSAFHLCVLSHQLHKCFKLYERCLKEPNDGGKSWQLTDKSGMTPLQLLESKIFQKSYLQSVNYNLNGYRTGAFSRCHNFGSNVNMQLGTGDDNDRMGTWYEIDAWKMTNENLSFMKCCMNKYYSLLLMTERNGHQFVYISGRSSKLNLLGKRDLFRYMKFTEESISDIQSSNHHFVAKTNQGRILLWGSNKYGQLGTNPKNFDSTEQPHHLDFSVSEDDIIACSNVNTCVLLKSGSLRYVGLDLGQFGATTKLEKDVCYLDHRGRITFQPVNTVLPSYMNNFLALVCTEFVTFILCGGNQLFALTNHKIIRVKSAPVLNDSFDKFFTREFHDHQIVDIKCKNSFGKFLMLLYDDGTVACISDFKNSSKPQSLWKPKYVWDKCISFDTGADGQLIVATAKGDIYTSSAIGRKFTKIRNGMSGYSTCKVSCDPLFASFNVITRDSFNDIKESDSIGEDPICITNPQKNFDLTISCNGKMTKLCHRAILLSSQEKFMNELIREKEIDWNSNNEPIKINLNTSNGMMWKINVEGPDEIADYLNNAIDSYYSLETKLLPVPNNITLQNFIDAYYFPSPFTSPPKYNKIMKNLLNSTSDIVRNVEIQLADDMMIKTSSILLQTHSVFFEKLFSIPWSKSSHEYKLNWKDVSLRACSALINYLIHLSNVDENENTCSEIPLNLGHQAYLDTVIEVLNIADKYMFLDLCLKLENQLKCLIDSSNAVSLWILSYDRNLSELKLRCENFILHNPSIIFSEYTTELVRNDVTKEMWKNLEMKFNTVLGFGSQLSWYYSKEASDMIEMFKTDILEFNSYFMANDREFELLLDSVSVTKTRQKSVNESRKQSFSKNARNQSSMEDLVNVRRPSVTSQNSFAWKSSFASSESAIDDDDTNSSFIEVSKKKKRRSSSVVPPGTSSSNSTTISKESVQTEFPLSLASTNQIKRNSSEQLFPSLGELSQKTSSNSKIKIKKQTQKERIKQIAENESKIKEERETKKSIWGQPIKKDTSIQISSNNSKISVSLSETPLTPTTKPASTKFPTLNEAVKIGKKGTGIVSVSGDGTKPTIPLYASKKNSLGWLGKETASSQIKSTQEALEEARFMKWWKEESERIQAEQLLLETLAGVETEHSPPTRNDEVVKGKNQRARSTKIPHKSKQQYRNNGTKSQKKGKKNSESKEEK